MRFIDFDKHSFYYVMGKIFIWGIVLFFLLYFAYDTGRQDGKFEGYLRGYSDAFFHLKPVNPNLSPDERDKIQKSPSIKPKKSSSKDEHGVLVNF